jgi:hypothetical protein
VAACADPLIGVRAAEGVERRAESGRWLRRRLRQVRSLPRWRAGRMFVPVRSIGPAGHCRGGAGPRLGAAPRHGAPAQSRSGGRRAPVPAVADGSKPAARFRSPAGFRFGQTGADRGPVEARRIGVWARDGGGSPTRASALCCGISPATPVLATILLELDCMPLIIVVPPLLGPVNFHWPQ